MKAIILARVSTEEQMIEGQSIPAQLGRARDYANKKGFEIQSEHQFEESSTKDQRKKFDLVINEIKRSKEKVALIVETVDRLQRGFKESVLLDEFRKEGKLDIHFIRENLIIHKDSNSSEIQRWDLAVFVAKSYVLQISDNVKRTFDMKIRKGEYTGKAPIGYLNSEDEKGNKTIIVDPNRAPFIVKIFELYSTGNSSMDTIARIVGGMGLNSKDRSDKRPKARQIESILKNPFYYGQMLRKGQIYPHKYEPIISYELFKKCQEVKASYKRQPKKNASKPYILKGLIKCDKCGCAISPEIHKDKYIYYSCTNHKKICKRVLVKEEKLLEPIIEVFKNLNLPDYVVEDVTESLKNVEKSKNEFHNRILNNLKTDYEKIDQKMSLMYDDRLEGRITADMYDKKLKEYSEKQQDLLFEMRKYQKANESFYLTANQVLNLGKRAYEIFESSETEEKRQLLNFVFQNFKLDGKNLLFETKTPFDTVLQCSQTSSWGGYRDSNPG